MRWLKEVLDHRQSAAPLIEVTSADGGAPTVLSFRSVFDAAIALADELSELAHGQTGTLSVGLLAGNSPEWLVADLACLLGRAVEVVVPLEFNADQARSLLRGVSVCLLDDAGAARLAQWRDQVMPPGSRCVPVDIEELARRGHGRPAPVLTGDDWVCKVVHTSGTTAAPKGVRVRTAGLDDLLTAVHQHIPAELDRRYASVVPLSMLVEQVSSYVTMLGGGTLVLLPPDVRLLGTAPDALPAVIASLPAARPTAMHAPPMLFEEFARIAAAHPDDDTSRLCQRLFGRSAPAFLACGGAPISVQVLTALADRGISVYEGYGLSEHSSVVAWNTPTTHRTGSVGRPLSHVEARIGDGSELFIRSTSLFDGYTGAGDPSSCQVDADGWLGTGDLAGIDSDGYLHIRGRKKDLVITSAGRDVAAGWVAACYQELPDVVAAVIFGDGLDELVGFFVVSDSVDEAELRADIGQHGIDHLSDIERVRRIETMRTSDPRLAGLFTLTGHARRDRIWALIGDRTTTTRPQQTLPIR